MKSTNLNNYNKQQFALETSDRLLLLCVSSLSLEILPKIKPSGFSRRTRGRT